MKGMSRANESDSYSWAAEASLAPFIGNTQTRKRLIHILCYFNNRSERLTNYYAYQIINSSTKIYTTS